MPENGIENTSPIAMSVFGVNLAKHSPTFRFFYLASIVFFFFLAYGYLQELFFSYPDFRPYSWYLTFFQFVVYTVFGAVDCLLVYGNPFKKIHVPLKTYCLFAFLQVSTVGLSNQAVSFLNYPTQVMFKSAKPLPVLFGSVVIQSKRPQIAEWLAAICMSVGIALFLLADAQLQLPIFQPVGVLLICMALCADAGVGNVQEKAMKKFSAPTAEILLFTYGIGSIYIFIFFIVSGTLFENIEFACSSPFLIHSIAFAFAVCGYLGQLGVLGVVRIFGAYIAAAVTTARKAVTIALSFLLFTKPFSFQYVLGFVIFTSGVYLQTHAKSVSDKLASYVKRIFLHEKTDRYSNQFDV